MSLAPAFHLVLWALSPGTALAWSHTEDMPPWMQALETTTSTSPPPEYGIRLCYQRYEASWFTGNGSASDCPAACPYKVQCASNPLIADYVDEGIRCVRSQDCYRIVEYGYPHESDNVCRECEIVGCLKCSTDGMTCDECGWHFKRSWDHKCTWKDEQLFTGICVVVGVFMFWVLFEFTLAHCLPITNKQAYIKGLFAHWRAKVRKYWLPSTPTFSFWANMHWLPKGYPPICGPGTTLFMNWFFLVAAVALWLMICAYVYGPDSHESIRVDNCYNILGTLPEEVASWTEDQRYKLEDPPNFSFDEFWMRMSYLGSVALSVAFLLYQHWLWDRLTDASSLRGDASPREVEEEGRLGGDLMDYCVEVSGFPPGANDFAAIRSFLQDELVARGFDRNCIHDMSIAYDYDEDLANRIESAIKHHLESREGHALVAPAGFRSHTSILEDTRDFVLRADEPSESDTDADQSSDSIEGVQVSFFDRGPFWVQFLSYFMFGTAFQCGPLLLEGESKAKTHSRLETLDLDEIPSSGHVYVVFETAEIARAFALRQLLYTHFTDEEGEPHTITAKLAEDSPHGVMWENFHISRYLRSKRVLIAALMIFGSAIIWFLLYLPFIYIFDIVTGLKFDDDSYYTTYLVETYAGLLIAVGNCMIAFVVQMAVKQMGFRYKGTEDLVYLALTIPCVGLNCFMDFFVVTQEVRTGSFTCSIFGGLTRQCGEDTVHDGYEWRIVHQEWVALIMPSYVLIPYIGEPIATLLLPLFLGLWRIKRDRSITASEAETIMKPSEVDQVNPPLNDLITTTATVIATFVYSPGAYTAYVFFLTFLWAIMLYVQNRVRILYLHSYTYCGHNRLHLCESVAWSLPLGLLAAAWGYSMSTRPPSQCWVSGAYFFVMHVLAHLIFVFFVVPWFSPHRGPCTEPVAQFMERNKGKVLATYINTNPVEVLKRLPEDQLQELNLTRDVEPPGKPVVFYRVDKFHLQPEIAPIHAAVAQKVQQEIKSRVFGHSGSTQASLNGHETENGYTTVAGLVGEE